MPNIISHIHCNRLLRLVQYISRYLDIYTPLTLERKLGSAVLMWHNTVSQGARGLLGESDCRHSSYMLHKQVNIAVLLLCPVDIRYLYQQICAPRHN